MMGLSASLQNAPWSAFSTSLIIAWIWSTVASPGAGPRPLTSSRWVRSALKCVGPHVLGGPAHQEGAVDDHRGVDQIKQDEGRGPAPVVEDVVARQEHDQDHDERVINELPDSLGPGRDELDIDQVLQRGAILG